MNIKIEPSHDRVLVTYEYAGSVCFEFLTLGSARSLSSKLQSAIRSAEVHAQFEKAIAKDR